MIVVPTLGVEMAGRLETQVCVSESGGSLDYVLVFFALSLADCVQKQTARGRVRLPPPQAGSVVGSLKLCPLPKPCFAKAAVTSESSCFP